MNKFLIVLVALAASVSVSESNKNNAAFLLETVKPLQMQYVNPHTGTEETLNGCTVFSANRSAHGWATVAHCVLDHETGEVRASQFYIAGHPASVVRVDVEHDLALLQITDGWGVPKAIKLSTKAPKIGDFIETLGFAYADKRPFYFAGYISLDEFEARRTPDWFGTFVGLVAVGGQSGSPVVNEDGKLIGLLHIGFGGTGEADPITGITSFEVLKAFDGGWVFER